MSGTQRFILVFIGSAIFCFGLFYFYPAEIFEAEVIGDSGSIAVDLSLKAILFNEGLPENLNPENIKEIKPTLSGALIMFIVIIGLPLMLAYRTVVKRKVSDEEE